MRTRLAPKALVEPAGRAELLTLRPHLVRSMLEAPTTTTSAEEPKSAAAMVIDRETGREEEREEAEEQMSVRSWWG